jgi:hypothetical protein
MITAKPRLEMLTRMVEVVESAVRLELRHFVEPPPGSKSATADEVRQMASAMSAFVSVLEDGVLEYDLRVNGSPDLLVRYLQTYADALMKAKSVRGILVAAIENALGAMRNETVEQRLRRSISVAAEEHPLYLGSFDQYADPDEPPQE